MSSDEHNSQSLQRRLADLSPRQLRHVCRKLLGTVRPAERAIFPGQDLERASLPMSFAQQHLWLLEQLELLGPGNNPGVTFRLRGALDVKLLERSFTQIVRRHESLRTHFKVIDGEGFQLIDPPLPFHVQLTDMTVEEAEFRERRLLVLERRQRERPFDLERDPLLRVGVFRLGPTEYVLQILMHHIVSDEWSMEILLRELGQLYSVYTLGGVAKLPKLEWQYADYTRWQREYLQGPVLQRHLEYWQSRLNDVPMAIGLPTDHARAAHRYVAPTYRAAVHYFDWPLDMSRRLRHASHSHNTSLSALLLCALQVVLGRWSGQQDIVVGTPVAGRTRRELLDVIGLFVNPLPLRTDLSGDPKVSELLGRVGASIRAADAHQDLAFGRLLAELRPPPSTTRTPLFQVTLNVDEIPGRSFQASGLTIDCESIELAGAHFDLAIYVGQAISGLRGRIDYAAQLFQESTIECLARELKSLLEQMIEHPDARLSSLRLSGPAGQAWMPAQDGHEMHVRVPTVPRGAMSEYVPPRTALEQTLAAIWAAVLRVERVGIHDNFFGLGGDSTAAVRALARIRTLTELEIPLWLLFDKPTVAGVAASALERHFAAQPADELAAAVLEARCLSPEADDEPEAG